MDERVSSGLNCGEEVGDWLGLELGCIPARLWLGMWVRRGGERIMVPKRNG